MKPNEMHKLSHAGTHDDCSPKGWHAVPKCTGDFDLDATILHRSNKNLPKRLELYLKQPKGSYGPRTGYNAYHGYSGDD